MKRKETQGSCGLCNNVFSRTEMRKHLDHCVASTQTGKAASAKGRVATMFRLLVTDFGPDYWLYLDMPDFAELSDLDQFLRDIWLECCGHLSTFTINDEQYDFMYEDGSEGGMEVPVADVFEEKLVFMHEYDFGSTTSLQLKVVDVREGRWTGRARVRLLARNLPPAHFCVKCGQPATQICACCFDEAVYTCNTCATDKNICPQCGAEALLPLVNSPRVGVCGYGA